ncbi:DUF3040 domain-containing protein [Planobispora longispora]|uniref:DUF3040 domain-containing protein n=1 Tax=Planobispora longispora TaxID=28887 RepID=A0A8J3WA46_9ACTN|nr:DUF3040 domain-containing protein [Planobispora longispora]BFE79321.1 hypothetical protein GCM10020093_019220 [Planobispora longispora]GIH81498.1 hypothetical protein Plo01_79270 [Planobispora longispora]
MGLSVREKRVLTAIAGQFRTEEPDLARSLVSFATGTIPTEILPSRRHMLVVALLAALMAVMAVVLPSLGGVGGDSIAATHAQHGG